MQRYFYLATGWICVALGFAGIWLPVMPTTIFLIIACWAFAKSSPEMRAWLVAHPRFGASLAGWYDHGAISLRAKASAVALMAASFAGVWAWTGLERAWLAALGLALAACAAFVVTRPSLADASLIIPDEPDRDA